MEEKLKTVTVIEQHERTVIRRTRRSVVSESEPVIEIQVTSQSKSGPHLPSWSASLRRKAMAAVVAFTRLLRRKPL